MDFNNPLPKPTKVEWVVMTLVLIAAVALIYYSGVLHREKQPVDAYERLVAKTSTCEVFEVVGGKLDRKIYISRCSNNKVITSTEAGVFDEGYDSITEEKLGKNN